jgi:hypothetical protein
MEQQDVAGFLGVEDSAARSYLTARWLPANSTGSVASAQATHPTAYATDRGITCDSRRREPRGSAHGPRRKTGPQGDEGQAVRRTIAGMAKPCRRFDRRPEPSSPILLPGFFACMLAVFAAVVAIGGTESDLADIGACVLLVLTAGVMLFALRWRLDDDAEEGP